MSQYHRVVWFDNDSWIGREISFEEPQLLIWKITEKLAEREMPWTEYEVTEGKYDSEAHCAFLCTAISDPSQEAVVKIRLQYVLLLFFFFFFFFFFPPYPAIDTLIVSKQHF